MGFASAAPPFEGVSTSNGLTVDALIYGTLKQNSDFTLHVHVYNSSNGINFSSNTVKCNVHLYNSTGNHILRNNSMYFDGNGDWELVINKGNFTNPGQYALEVWCTNPNMGGSERLYFDVTPTGNKGDISSLALIGLLIFLSMLFLALSFTLQSKAIVVRTSLIIISILITILAINMSFDFLATQRQYDMLFYSMVIAITSTVALIFYITVTYIKSIAKAAKEIRNERDSDGLI